MHIELFPHIYEGHLASYGEIKNYEQGDKEEWDRVLQTNTQLYFCWFLFYKVTSERTAYIWTKKI
jgi:hypothetical protein